ncbi:hypothetical protein OK006_8856 [Actinobacteria bacterium OK006]|nr:hypothetical protein OK006_8856 [Actinobacteria bacterium OK006]
MGTAERGGTPGVGTAVPVAARSATRTPDRDIPVDSADGRDEVGGQGVATHGRDRVSRQSVALEGRDRKNDRAGAGIGSEHLNAQAVAVGGPEPVGGRGTATGGHQQAVGEGTASGRRHVNGQARATVGHMNGYEEQAYYRPLWIEEPARRRRLPDPVRTSAVRAVLIIAVTLIQAVIAFLSTLAESWLAFPMVLSSVASTVVATWAALDVWVTRQVWNQRNGVVSEPSSTARTLRRERRRGRRQARATERAQERIRRQGGTGQLSHL